MRYSGSFARFATGNGERVIEMIELRDDQLVFRFPEVHGRAEFVIDFQRTLRIPDDGHEYPLPAGLGSFPLAHVDDHASTVPRSWLAHGGVVMPMHQGEALWLNFCADRYPFAVKVAAGKVNAVTGGAWSTQLTHGPTASSCSAANPAEQDYVVLPEQPWLDGFNVGDDRIRQFVAMPLGAGYTAEEQITGVGEHGGIQILAYPMKAVAYAKLPTWDRNYLGYLGAVPDDIVFSRDVVSPDMGLGLGGLMHQEIEADPHDRDVWDLDHPARCFIHLANAEQWKTITGLQSPTTPPTPEQYRAAGIPWFDYDTPGLKVPGSDVLAGLDTVAKIAKGQRLPLPNNDSVPIDRVIKIVPRKSRPVNHQG